MHFVGWFLIFVLFFRWRLEVLVDSSVPLDGEGGVFICQVYKRDSEDWGTCLR